MAKSGAFSNWVSRNVSPEVTQFAGWAKKKMTSHPIDRLERTLSTGKAMPASDSSPMPSGDTEPYGPAPKGPVKVPEMLKEKYWRPGARGK